MQMRNLIMAIAVILFFTPCFCVANVDSRHGNEGSVTPESKLMLYEGEQKSANRHFYLKQQKPSQSASKMPLLQKYKRPERKLKRDFTDDEYYDYIAHTGIFPENYGRYKDQTYETHQAVDKEKPIGEKIPLEKKQNAMRRIFRRTAKINIHGNVGGRRNIYDYGNVNATKAWKWTITNPAEQHQKKFRKTRSALMEDFGNEHVTYAQWIRQNPYIFGCIILNAVLAVLLIVLFLIINTSLGSPKGRRNFRSKSSVSCALRKRKMTPSVSPSSRLNKHYSEISIPDPRATPPDKGNVPEQQSRISKFYKTTKVPDQRSWRPAKRKFPFGNESSRYLQCVVRIDDEDFFLDTRTEFILHKLMSRD